MSYLVTKTVSHQRAVCSLYKRALRNLEAWCFHRDTYRYRAVKLRAEFDKQKGLTDVKKAKELLDAGELELEKKLHPNQLYFPNSPGGISYERAIEPPDWVLDYWHPFEKAQYPKYFATREQRKLEYIEMFEEYMKRQKLGDEGNQEKAK